MDEPQDDALLPVFARWGALLDDVITGLYPAISDEERHDLVVQLLHNDGVREGLEVWIDALYDE